MFYDHSYKALWILTSAYNCDYKSLQAYYNALQVCLYCIEDMSCYPRCLPATRPPDHLPSPLIPTCLSLSLSWLSLFLSLEPSQFQCHLKSRL